MDRNTIIGFTLIIAILFGWTWWTAPNKEEAAQAKRQADSLANVQALQQAARAAAAVVAVQTDTARTNNNPAAQFPLTDSALQIVMNGRFGPFAPAAEGQVQQVVLANEQLEVRLSTKGAAPTWIRLKEFNSYQGEPLLLADPDSGHFTYRFFLGNLDLSTADLYFDVVEQSAHRAVLRARTTDASKNLTITYTLDSAGYFLGSTAQWNGLEDVVDTKDLYMDWQALGLSNEKHLPSERQKSSVYYKYFNDDRNYLSETDAEEKNLSGRTNWVAFKQDFFTAAVVSETGFSSGDIAIEPLADSSHTKRYSAKLYFEGGKGSALALPLRFYLGPNHYNTLRRTKIPQFDRIIDLGWGIFGWMNRYLVIPIFNFLGGLKMNYGIIILVLTIAIKLLLMPLTYRNQRSSVRMRALRPETEAINERYKDGDPMKKQQAIMELYRKARVNPAAGCVPLLIQMPVLYAMFRFFPSSIELRQQRFLWADDLSSYDSIAQLPFTVPFGYGEHVSLFTLLMCASTIVYSLINSNQMPQQQGMPSMKLMIWLFPIMMLFFMNSLPAGLSYYYLLANVISILQMTVLSRWFIDESKLRAELLENMKKPVKKGKWQMRLEEMQKQQKAQRR
jgi:YidC/Oxa1 family membrane protein insertase